MSDWKYEAPPNETLVEVELDGEIIQVMAYFGRDGVRPHWRSNDGKRHWAVDAFQRWRPIKEGGDA